jgi:hypothetical protein
MSTTGDLRRSACLRFTQPVHSRRLLDRFESVVWPLAMREEAVTGMPVCLRRRIDVAARIRRAWE